MFRSAIFPEFNISNGSFSFVVLKPLNIFRDSTVILYTNSPSLNNDTFDYYSTAPISL